MVETINKPDPGVSRQLLQELGRGNYSEEIYEMEIFGGPCPEILKISEPVSFGDRSASEEDSHLGDFIQDDNVLVPADVAAFTLP